MWLHILLADLWISPGSQFIYAAIGLAILGAFISRNKVVTETDRSRFKLCIGFASTSLLLGLLAMSFLQYATYDSMPHIPADVRSEALTYSLLLSYCQCGLCVVLGAIVLALVARRHGFRAMSQSRGRIVESGENR